MMTKRYALALFAVLTLALVTGCNTYLQQKTDVVAGGPENREREAKEQQDAARDTGSGLQDDLEALAEERAYQDQKLATLDQLRKAQEIRIANARAQNNITRAEEQLMREQVMSLDREIRSVELGIQAARASADTRQEEAFRNGLAELEDKAAALDAEIDQLLQ